MIRIHCTGSWSNCRSTSGMLTPSTSICCPYRNLYEAKQVFTSATRSSLLDGGTFHRPVTAKHTAISFLRFQSRMATLTLVKELTCINRHRLLLLMPTHRASDHRF